MNTIYVRSEVDRWEMKAELLKMLPKAEVDSNRGWVVAFDPDLPDPTIEVKLLRLSRMFDAVVYWISYQTVVDAFQFHHWQGGNLLRSLVYGCCRERTWERVEGVAESWEKEILFSAEVLASILSFYENPSDRARLERIWRDQLLLPGEDEPSLNAEEVAGRVIEALDLG